MVVLGLTSLTVALTDMKPYTHLQLVPHMTTYHQVCSIGRLITEPTVLADIDTPICIRQFYRAARGRGPALSRWCSYREVRLCSSKTGPETDSIDHSGLVNTR
jgi:hypothetical protein